MRYRLHGLLLAVSLAAIAAIGACGSDESGGGSSSSSSGTTTTSSSGHGGGGAGGSSSGGGSSSSSGSGGTGAATVGCEPLPAATGNVTEVDPSQTGQLQSIVASAVSGDTIALADGTYALDGAYLWIDTPGITIRSQSGDREAVILDGGYNSTEIITVAASDVTIADITIEHAHTHPIHVVSGDSADTVNTLIYNVHLIDPRQQAIKINPSGNGHFVDDGEIACSTVELTDQGRPHVDPTATGCYTGGVDGHQARGWVIRDNVFRGFWCSNGLSEHAVHCWRGCRDTIVERNSFIDNARGVGFGLSQSGSARTYDDNPCPAAGNSYVGHYGGVVRNNFIFVSDPGLLASKDGFDCGVCLWSACNATAVHNSIVSTGDNFSSIEWRFPASSGVTIANNIVTHPLRERDGASGTQTTNLEGAPLSTFIDGPGGNLHLSPDATAAIDQGTALSGGLCDDDIDGEPRADGKPDIGADELH